MSFLTTVPTMSTKHGAGDLGGLVIGNVWETKVIIVHAGQPRPRPFVTPEGRTSDTAPTGKRVQNRLSGDPSFRRRPGPAGFQDLAAVSASMPSSVSWMSISRESMPASRPNSART